MVGCELGAKYALNDCFVVNGDVTFSAGS